MSKSDARGVPWAQSFEARATDQAAVFDEYGVKACSIFLGPEETNSQTLLYSNLVTVTARGNSSDDLMNPLVVSQGNRLSTQSRMSKKRNLKNQSVFNGLWLQRGC